MGTESRNRFGRRFCLAIAALALATSARAQADLAPGARGDTPPAEIKIVSTEFKYVPARVWAVAGRPVTLVLDNSKAETEHGIFVPALGFRLMARAGEIVRTTTVFDKPGEFEFVCDNPGHREAGMKGMLIVGRF